MHFVDVPHTKLGFFKRNWIQIITPIVKKQCCDIRMNLREKRIEIKPRDTDDSVDEGTHRAYRSQEYIRAVLYGFTVENALFLLKNQSTSLVEFNIDDCKKYNQSSKSRAVGRLIGRKGVTKRNIEKNLSVRICIRGADFYLIGTSTNLDLAKSFITKLIKGSSQSSIHSKMSAIGERLKSNLY
eukprot:GAHX01000728.1.p1 GENE.GAHX01000728.1~~GAHX01000728.1.p1  ORF type:complete len:184 (+),score=28.52 GAHX01000728.1:35-586(+)